MESMTTGGHYGRGGGREEKRMLMSLLPMYLGKIHGSFSLTVEPEVILETINAPGVWGSELKV